MRNHRKVGKDFLVVSLLFERPSQIYLIIFNFLTKNSFKLHNEKLWSWSGYFQAIFIGEMMWSW